MTPRGPWESRRLPGSGAGPSPDRLLLGLEGILGVITEAWVRVRRRPAHRGRARGAFPSFAAGAEARAGAGPVRASPRPTAACWTRWRRRRPARATAADAVLVLGFESADHPVDADLARWRWRRARSTAAARTTRRGAPGRRGTPTSAGGRRSSGCPTCGTCCAPGRAVATPSRRPSPGTGSPGCWREVHGGGRPRRWASRAGSACRFTHVYPDGPAPYFTVLAPADRDDPVGQWWRMKRAAGDAILASGGTITHHHAVGRDHRAWYDRQRPDAVRPGAARGQARGGPGGHPQPRCPAGPGPAQRRSGPWGPFRAASKGPGGGCEAS